MTQYKSSTIEIQQRLFVLRAQRSASCWQISLWYSNINVNPESDQFS